MKKLLATLAIAAGLVFTASFANAQPAGFCTLTESCIANTASVCTEIATCPGLPTNLLPLNNAWTGTQTHQEEQLFDFDIADASVHFGEDNDIWQSYDGTFNMLTFSTGQAVGTYFAAFAPTSASTNYGGAAFFSPFAASDSASALVVAPDLNNSTNTMNGTDTWKALEIDLGDHSNQNHTGVSNFVIAESIESVISPDADAQYRARQVGTGFAYHDVISVLGTAPAAPQTNQVGFYIDEAVDRGAGTATADCALVARLSSGADVVVQVLVTDGGCP